MTVLFFFCQACPVWPQDPSSFSDEHSRETLEVKIRNEIQEKLRRRSLKKPELEVPVRKPEKAPALSAFVREIELAPHESLSINEFKALVRADDYRPLLASLEGRDATFAELEQVAVQIEEGLRTKGYFSVVRIPPQETTEGKIKMEVLLSRMGTLEVEGAKYFRASKTRSYWKMQPGEILTYDKILRSAILMNEIPDREVKPVLKAGKAVGTTDVILKSKERFPLHASYSFDNQGVKLTGRERHGFTLQYNNLLSLDDTFLIGTLFGNTYGAVFLQHLIPLNSRGTKFTWGLSHSQVNPQKEFKSLGINGLAQNYQMGLRQQILSTEAAAAHLFSGFAFKEKNTRISNETTTWDRLRVLNVGSDIQSKDCRGVWTLRPDFSLGFSPHGDGFALTSREAESHFFKAAYKVNREQILPFSTTGVLKIEGQHSPDKLPPSEQLFLGGAETVRGYPEGDYGADQALLVSAEYRVPAFLFPPKWHLPCLQKSLREQIQLFGFGDYAYGRLRDPGPTESRTRALIGTGFGFSIALSEKISGVLQWGFPLGEDPLTESGDSQFYFRLQVGL